METRRTRGQAPGSLCRRGLKAPTENGWFAVRPSGTENICRIYAERLKGEDHLHEIMVEAKRLME